MTHGMKTALVSGIFTILGAAIGASMGVFQEDIRNSLNTAASNQNQYLLGSWDTVTPRPSSMEPDNINITTVRGNLVKGVGTTRKFGDYDLVGRAGELAVSFSYTGKREQQRYLTGAIVLKKVNSNLMTGGWTEYRLNGDVVTGTTTWRRAPK